jgi:DNA-binding XRE family transcriptional regulator
MSERTKRVVQGLCVSLKDVAHAIGVSHDTLKGWSSGRTDPSPTNRSALADYMRDHAKTVERLAERLQGSTQAATVSANSSGVRRSASMTRPRPVSPGADIRLTRDGDSVYVENSGLTRALRVQVECFCASGRSLFAQEDRTLPIRELQPGAGVRVPACFSFACAPPLTAKIRWRSPRGEAIERWVVMRED